MKRTLVSVLILALLLVSWQPHAGAQGAVGGPAEQIDDLTPPPAQPAGKVDDSDEHRIPEAYARASGGPDPFGYTYADSDGGGCTFDWIEIDTTGTDLGLDGDDVGGAFSFGFSFPFYENSYDTIGAASNGYLTFGPDLTDYSEDPIPTATDPNDLIAVFWDDQDVDQPNGDAIYYQLIGSPGSYYLVVEFVVRDLSGTAPYRYQAILYENGDLKYQYQEMTTDPDGNGASATVGIENSTGTIGLGYLYHLNPPENEIHNDLAVCYRYPDNVYLSPGWQAGFGTEEQVVSYDLVALNQTGTTQDFGLSVEDYVWATAVEPSLVSIPDGGSVMATVVVTIPPGTIGLTDTATVRIAAVADPIVYSDTAQVETGSLSGFYGYTGASTTDEAAIFDQQLWDMFQRLDLLPEGDYPYDATIRPGGDEVWIPGAVGDGVVVIDTTTNQITQRIAVGEYPVSVAFRKDSAYAFVANRDTEDVSVVDTGTYGVIDTIPVPVPYQGPGNLALNPCGGELYLVNWYYDYLFVLDTEAFTVTQVLPDLGTNLWQLVVDPLGEKLYITDRGLDVVHVLDTVTLSEIATIPVGDDPWGIDITPDGTLIYVANEDSHDVTAIDAVNNSVITTIGLPHGDGSDPRDLDFDQGGVYAFVTSGDVSGNDEVYVIDTATHAVVGRIDVYPASNPNVVAVAPQVAGCLDLIADKQATPEPVVLGDPLTYTLSYNYAGLTPAIAALVTDTLPAGVAYLTSSGGLTSTYDAVDHQVIWELGDVDPRTQGELTAVVQPMDGTLAGEVITNEAYLDFTSFRNFSATVWAWTTVVTPEMAIRFPDGTEPDDPLLWCDRDAVTLMAESNRPGPLAYAWELGDGTVADTPVVTHSWLYGDYTVLLTTTNAYGWVETDTLGVEVGHKPLAGFLSNTPVELGENAVFTDRTAYDPETWFWDFGDGIGTSDQQDPVYNYSNPGIYTVTLTVTNYCDADVYSESFEVLVPELYYYVYVPVVAKDSP